MSESAPFVSVADLVLMLHAAVALFLTISLVLILIGWWRRWAWCRLRLFRWIHLGGLLVVAVESWLGVVCPLTTLEQWLRLDSSAATYQSGFIHHWVSQLLFYSAPLWLFGLIYTLALALTLLAMWRYPPRR